MSVFFCLKCADREFGAPINLDAKVADACVVFKRRGPRFIRFRDPAWREAVAFRFGFPLLGAISAIGFAWVIIHV
jgi:hypothetical protein